MNENVENTTDPIEAAHKATQDGIELLRQMRARQASELAERDQITAKHAAELAEAEELFAKAEAEERHLREVGAASERFEAAKSEYEPLRAEADRLIVELDAALTEVAKKVGDAMLAERARVAAGEPVKAAHANLEKVAGAAPHLNVQARRLHDKIDPRTAMGALICAGILADERLASDRGAITEALTPQKHLPAPNMYLRNI